MMAKQNNDVAVTKVTNLKAVQSAIATMTTSTLKEYNDIRRRAEDLTRADLMTKHHIGTRINAMLSDENTYGSNAVGKLAIALNVSKDYLYKLKHIAVVWTKDELQEIVDLSTGDSTKMPVTYSHLEVLASIPKKSKRDKLLARVMDHWLTVQQLIDLVREELGVRRQNTGPRMPKTTSAAINKLTAMSTKVMEYAPILHKALSENFNEKEVDNELVAALQVALSEQRNLLKAVKAVCDDLESVKNKAMEMLSIANKKTAKHLVDHKMDEVLEGEVVDTADDDDDEDYEDVEYEAAMSYLKEELRPKTASSIINNATAIKAKDDFDEDEGLADFDDVYEDEEEEEEEDPDNYVYFDSRGKVRQ